MNLWAVMISNTLIQLGWLATMVYLISTNHNGWAVAVFIGALFSGYSYKTNKKSGDEK